MATNWNRSLKGMAATASAALLVHATAGGQTLPIAGDPRQAIAQDRADRDVLDRNNRDAVRGVREQDQAAVRTANRLNRDLRQEARQELNQTVGQGTIGERNANLRPGIDGNLHDTNSMNSGLRGADLGLWFNSRPGMNGLVVADVATQGAFAQAGFREGDRIMSINGQPVTTEAQFVQALMTPGAQSASIIINRNGQPFSVAVQPPSVIQNIAAVDPLFQSGVLLDERNPNQMVVQRVLPRTPAFYAGLRPGDVITTINGQQITSLASLTQALQTGGNLALQVTRNGQTRDLSLTGTEDLLRTALRPNTNLSANVGTTTATTQAGAVTGTQPDQSGLNTTGTVAPATSTALSPAVPGTPTGTTPTTGGTTSGATSTLQSGGGVPSVTRGIPTAVPGLSPTTLPGSGNVLAPPVTNFGPVNPGVGPTLPAGTTVGGATTSSMGPVNPAIPGGTSPASFGTSANPAVPAFGSASATGATGTTGGTGSTAGGAGAVGGTGATGGAGSTAGPSGGNGAVGTGAAAGGT